MLNHVNLKIREAFPAKSSVAHLTRQHGASKEEHMESPLAISITFGQSKFES